MHGIERSGTVRARITSYNVCYTKLLRLRAQPPDVAAVAEHEIVDRRLAFDIGREQRREVDAAVGKVV